MKYVLEKDSNQYELMGGKATALSKLGKAINNIPDWFVVSFEGLDIETKSIKEEAKKEIEERIKNFPQNSYFAIRSSAGNEDSAENSFAGQFDTFLYVKKEEILEKILEVYMSAFSERIETYRKENNIEEITIPSAIVQKMVNSRCSGVAFGANPVNSNIKEIVVSAVYGLGSGLVDGIATADTYTIINNEIEKNIATKDYCHVLENGKVVQKNVEPQISNNQILKDDEIIEVKELVKNASEYFGRYQDIEWAYEDNNLYLLQSRPITTLGNNKAGKINVFDNSNIVESYGGITTPLTFSFIRMVYENVYIELCKIFNVKQEKIEMNSQMFKNMLALIDGRVYYNLYGWYGMLSMFPGLGNNKKFMEQMMGVKESLPDDLFPVPEATFKDKLGLLNTGWGLVKGFLKIRKMTEKFYVRLNDALEDKDIDNMDLYELHDYYYELEKKLLHKWDAPLVNDFLAMIFYGKLKQECNNLFKDEGDMIHNDLLCNEGGIISSEPAKRIKEMARVVKNDDTLIELLQNKDMLYIKKELPKYPEFNNLLNQYLNKFSDRCLEELKLETLTLKDNPSNLYNSIATFAKRLKEKELVEIDERKNRIEAEKKVSQKLKYKPVQKAKFNYLLKQARYTVKNRENLRFERTLLFGRVRELFLRIGFILASMNVIEEKRDIFYLEVDEILFYIDGKSTTNDLKELIKIRKNEYLNYQNKLPDERFYSYGAVNVGNDFKREKIGNQNTPSKNINANTSLKGIGASPGVVTGKVRIIKNPANAKLEQGEILVAEFTDPGWIMLFPAASGILVERGSLLSHSAIVSRELGIPAVVGITGLLDTLKTGDFVELNGTTGEVKIIESTQKTKELNTIEELLKKTVDEHSNNTLYELENEKKISYTEFYNEIQALKNGINILKTKSNNIAIISENRYEWELAFFSIISSNKVVVPIDKSLTKNEIKNIIKKAEVDTVFCSKKYEELIKEIPEIKNVISFDSEELSYKKLLEAGSKGVTDTKQSKPDDVCVILFTSGTTNNPKAVMLTNKNICENSLAVQKVFDISENDIFLSVMPLNHVLEGLFCLFTSISKGAKRVFCNELDEILEYINKYNITFMGAVPAVYEYLYENKEDLKKEANHINMFMSGGASLNVELINKYKEVGINLIQGYGLTECSPVVSLENKTNRKNGSVGKVIPGLEIKLENIDNNGIGEITIKGSSVMKGYYKDENLTKESIIEQYFHTGDLGKIDEDGYIYLCGRSKSMIVLKNGKKIFPEEIEAVINEINGVKESFVYEKNNSINAKIVCEELSKETEKIVKNEIHKLNEKLPIYKRINDIIITTKDLEKTSTNKIKRNEELEKIEKDTNDVVAEVTEDIESQVKSVILGVLGNKEVQRDSELRNNLGADSLNMVEIFLAIEKKFNIKIPKEQKQKIVTVGDIINLLET